MFAREEEPDNCSIVWCVREQKVRATKPPLRLRLLKILIFKKHIIINIYYLQYHTIVVLKRAFFFNSANFENLGDAQTWRQFKLILPLKSDGNTEALDSTIKKWWFHTGAHWNPQNQTQIQKKTQRIEGVIWFVWCVPAAKCYKE